MINKSKTFSRKAMISFFNTDLVKVIMTSTDLTKEEADVLAQEVISKCQ